MRTMMGAVLLLAVLLVGVLPARSQQTTQLSFNQTYNSQPNSAFSGTFALPAFTSSDKLIDVKVDFTVILTANEDLHNARNTRQNTDIHYFGYLEYQVPGFAETGRPPFTTDPRWFDFTGTASVPANGIANVNLRDTNGNLIHVFPEFISHPPPSSFATYKSAPTLAYNFMSGDQLTNPGPFFSGVNISGVISGTITYTSTPSSSAPAVPEPGSAALVTLCMLSSITVLVGRHKQARACAFHAR